MVTLFCDSSNPLFPKGLRQSLVCHFNLGIHPGCKLVPSFGVACWSCAVNCPTYRNLNKKGCVTPGGHHG